KQECRLCKVPSCDTITCSPGTKCEIVEPENCFENCPSPQCLPETCEEDCIACTKEMVSCDGVRCGFGLTCEVSPQTCDKCASISCVPPKSEPCVACPEMLQTCAATTCLEGSECKVTEQSCHECSRVECISQLGGPCGQFTVTSPVCAEGLSCNLDTAIPDVGGTCIEGKIFYIEILNNMNIKEECIQCTQDVPSCAARLCEHGSTCEVTKQTCHKCAEATCLPAKEPECVACTLMMHTCEEVNCEKGYECKVVQPKDCSECEEVKCVPVEKECVFCNQAIPSCGEDCSPQNCEIIQQTCDSCSTAVCRA
ncbi:hypothetical protein HK099_005509, partial [Clydaea vesicula]